MASQELVRTLDFILNRCSERDFEAVSAAVARRRRDFAIFGDMSSAGDPYRMAKDISSRFSFEETIEGLKTSVRDYAIRIIKQQAPELTDEQINELTQSWIPDFQGSSGNRKKAASLSAEPSIPKDLLASMIDQFVSFSLGRMEEEDDKALRKDIGPWPDKYWKAFPQVIRLLITDFLKGVLSEDDFNARIGLALKL